MAVAFGCPHPMVMGDALCKWPSPLVTWRQAVTLANLTHEQVEGCYQRAWARWEAVCGVRPVEIVDITLPVNLIATNDYGPAEGFDAANTILALTELPCGVSQGTMLWQRINDHEAWTEEFLYAVLLHELGHAIGLVHSSDPADVMYPYYNPAVTDLSPGDVAQAVLRYGPAPAMPPAPEPPAPVQAPTPGTVQAPGPAADKPPPDLSQPFTFPIQVDRVGDYQLTFRVPFHETGNYTGAVTFERKPDA